MGQQRSASLLLLLAVALAASTTQGFDIRELYGKPVQGSVSKGSEGGTGGRHNKVWKYVTWHVFSGVCMSSYLCACVCVCDPPPLSQGEMYFNAFSDSFPPTLFTLDPLPTPNSSPIARIQRPTARPRTGSLRPRPPYSCRRSVSDYQPQSYCWGELAAVRLLALWDVLAGVFAGEQDDGCHGEWCVGDVEQGSKGWEGGREVGKGSGVIRVSSVFPPTPSSTATFIHTSPSLPLLCLSLLF